MKTLIIAFALLPSVAHAAFCGARAHIIDQLTDSYDEALRLVAVSGNGIVLEFFGTRDGGTWSIVTTDPDNMQSCIQAAGIRFDLIELVPTGAPL